MPELIPRITELCHLVTDPELCGVIMLRLLLLLCASIFLVQLIGGREDGPLRAGLANRSAEPASPPQVMAVTPQPVAEIRPPQTNANIAQPAALRILPAPPPPEPMAAVDQPAPDSALPFAQVAAEIAAQAAPQSASLQGAAMDTPADIRVVTARAVNVRGGPSTNFDVVGGLLQGDEVLVVEPASDGWARVRIEGDGIEGYVATRFLAESNR